MEISEDSLFLSVKQIITQSCEKVFRIANSTLLLTYWQIEQLIVEDEQKGQERATYGKYTLKNLSQKLSVEFGKGFDESNLSLKRQMNSLAYESILEHKKSPVENIHRELKDSYIFEFLGLKPDEKISEREIETGIIDHIQKFLLEFGKECAFVTGIFIIPSKSRRIKNDLLTKTEFVTNSISNIEVQTKINYS